MTSLILKIIAIISMVLDHTNNVFNLNINVLTYIGRFAFPIFAFQLVQGFIHTKNVNKYLLKLFIFACISQIPYMMFTNISNRSFSLNILFTLALGLYTLIVYGKISNIKMDYLSREKKIYKNIKDNPINDLNKFLAICICIIISAIANFLHFDYGMYGILLIFVFYLFKDKKIKLCISTIILTTLYFSTSIISTYPYLYYILCNVFTILSLIPILLYNGNEGKKLKYFFYIFYPLHLILLIILTYII